MKTLITGGAGFVGSHLCERLLAEGHSVTVVDDLSTGRIDNLSPCRSNDRFSFHEDTIMNRALMARLVEASDVVFHLAAAVGVRLIVESPVRTIETNVHGTEVVLQSAAPQGTPVFVFSTSEVYGKSTRIPFAEDHDLVLGPTTRSRWSYACSKAIDEFLALAYAREKGLPVVVVRLFNTVGPRQTGRYGMVLPTFVRQALAGQAITVFGNGEQSRCFCHVSDVVEALVRLLGYDAGRGRVFNIGSDEEVSILELARLVCRKADSPSEIQLIPYDEAYGEGFEDMVRRVPDLSRIQSAIGYECRHRLEDIVESVVEYERGVAHA